MKAESYLSRGVSPTKDDVKKAVSDQSHGRISRFILQDHPGSGRRSRPGARPFMPTAPAPSRRQPT